MGKKKRKKKELETKMIKIAYWSTILSLISNLIVLIKSIID